jgi:hypothetical protein
MSEKKVVGKGGAIVLAIICIVLVAGLIGETWQYTSLVKERDTINSEYQDYVSTHHNTDTEVDSLVSEYNSLQSDYNSLQSIYLSLWNNFSSLQTNYNSLQSNYSVYVYSHSYTNAEYYDMEQITTLSKSTEWVASQTVSQPQSSYSYWTFYAQYAGYIVVTVQSSTTTNTYVEVIYASHGVSYDNRVVIGTTGTPAFPVLPTWVQIRVGNTNYVNGATETVTITYWY